MVFKFALISALLGFGHAVSAGPCSNLVGRALKLAEEWNTNATVPLEEYQQPNARSQHDYEEILDLPPGYFKAGQLIMGLSGSPNA